MSQKKSERVYLLYILDATEKLMTFSKEPDARNQYETNWLIREGVFRKLQTMAETTQRLSDKTKGAMPEIEWSKITGFRHVMVHDYLGDLDMETVWRVVTHDVPVLDATIRKFYEGYDEQ